MSESEVNEPKKSRSNSSVPFLVYFKSIILTAMIVAAIIMFYTSRSASHQSFDIKKSPTLNALAALKNQIQTFEADDIATIASSSGVQQISHQVLGEVTKHTDSAIEKGVEKSTDYFYEHTVEQMIIALLARLPERQQKLILNRMCEKR